jgi:hypothetical protein
MSVAVPPMLEAKIFEDERFRVEVQSLAHCEGHVGRLGALW